MDINTWIICFAVFIVSAIIIFLISSFAVKEKTYEEAIAEQRMKGLGLHITKTQSVVKSTKEMKHKKLGKKVKEKGSENRNESHPSPVIEEKPPVEGTKLEAEVKTEPASLGDQKEKKKKEKKLKGSKEEIAPPEGEKREKKKKERKPKLVIIEEDVAQIESLESGEEDVSLTISSKKSSTDKHVQQEEPVQADNSEEPPKTQTVVPDSAPSKTAETPAKVEEVMVCKAKNEMQTQTQTEPPAQSKEKAQTMSAKERKKKKNELNSLLEADGTGDILSGKGLLPLLHKAVLTDGEIQNLIETLLNKQQQGGAGSEWLDASGRLDPVSALKKQLAEKEEALKEEQDKSQACQAKLRELKTDLNHAMHARRTFEESLIKREQETQALHARIQHNHDQHIGEIQTMQSQLQQVQSKMNEEHVRQVRQLQEEKNQLQQAMTQLEQEYSSSQMELETLRTTQDQYDTRHAAMQQAQNDLAAQVQQLEDHMRKQEQQKREDEESHKNQICQLTSQLMESENARSALSASVEKLQESQESAEYRNAMLQKKVGMLETSSAKIPELTSQLEEANKVKLEVDLRIKDMESKTENLTACLSEREKEVMQLQEENEALVVQLTSATTRPAAEGQENAEKETSDILQNEAEPKADKVDIKQYEMLITEKDGAIQKLMNEICEKDGAIDKISSEICDYKSELRNIREELDTQRKKNNVLREKNWKAMEALSAAEKSLEIKMKESDKLVSEFCHNAVEKEQILVRELLQRIFPTVCVKSCKEHNLWIERFESEAHQYIQELSHLAESEQKATQRLQAEEEDLTARLTESEEQNSKLQAQVSHYKIVLNETEGILNKLQNSVEAEERVWEQKLEGKEAELETVQKEKESLDEQVQLMEEQIQSLQEQLRAMEDSMEQLHAAEEMQEKLHELQEKLQGEETEKRTLALKCDQAHKNYTDLHKQLDEAQEQLTSLHDLQRELEEAKLATEQERKVNREISSQVVKLNSLVRIGQDAVNAEQETVKKLQEQLSQAKAPAESATANGPASASPVEQPVSKTLERKTAPSRTSHPTSEKKYKSKKKGGSTKK